MLRCLQFLLVLLFVKGEVYSQHLYYKKLSPAIVYQFADSSQRLVLPAKDSMLKAQLNFVIRFFPDMVFNKITVTHKNSKLVAKTKPTFFSIFKAPKQRDYKINFSNLTNSTLDSVILTNLSFNSQMGLLANQVSLIEDLSTGGFFNFVTFYFQKLTAKGKDLQYRNAEQKALEIGLGYQLLSYNEECNNKLKIDNWLSTIGYTTYIRYYKTVR